MDTKEQLTYAAKACGLRVNGWDSYNFGGSLMVDGECLREATIWNPIYDQADSDRMGTKLRMNVEWTNYGVEVRAYNAGQVFSAFEYFADHNGDENAALRAARLCCAAEIGKGMES